MLDERKPRTFYTLEIYPLYGITLPDISPHHGRSSTQSESQQAAICLLHLRSHNPHGKWHQNRDKTACFGTGRITAYSPPHTTAWRDPQLHCQHVQKVIHSGCHSHQHRGQFGATHRDWGRCCEIQKDYISNSPRFGQGREKFERFCDSLWNRRIEC